MSETPAQLWRALVSAEPARPFVTSYDASGARVELSRATFDNWVSKTANMLVDGFGAQPGDSTVLALPVHWQSLVWAVSCWSVGTVVTPSPRDTVGRGAHVVVADADRLEEAADTGADEVVGTSLHPLGLPLASVPPMVHDYSVEVRGHGDHFAAYPIDPGAPALEADRAYTGAELAAVGRDRAARWGLNGEDRIAVLLAPDAPLSALGPSLDLFLAALASGAPLILTPPGADDQAGRLRMEKATAVTAPEGDEPDFAGLRRL
ncbi:TIGR03089 family protein [Nocardiopsis sp. NRRL B-16309]|uniref:TIGR03089 family protein n=1 Tax=Nocardiopsis sp. NRRL B-16309 TaxID=1519494 RepID=UPI0006B055D7|nr:TIGR03089 family protein [Nocardiopsis sp. NRRL B-16309]KOX12174.1 AMP-dependent synthetase [Nocardiopsis sp. NRRL B-16309]